MLRGTFCMWMRQIWACSSRIRRSNNKRKIVEKNKRSEIIETSVTPSLSYSQSAMLMSLQ